MFLDGLSQCPIGAIPDEESNCTLCSEDFKIGGSSSDKIDFFREDKPEVPVMLRCCNNPIGSTCLRKWLNPFGEVKNSCPYCRKELFRNRYPLHPATQGQGRRRMLEWIIQETKRRTREGPREWREDARTIQAYWERVLRECETDSTRTHARYDEHRARYEEDDRRAAIHEDDRQAAATVALLDDRLEERIITIADDHELEELARQMHRSGTEDDVDEMWENLQTINSRMNIITQRFSDQHDIQIEPIGADALEIEGASIRAEIIPLARHVGARLRRLEELGIVSPEELANLAAPSHLPPPPPPSYRSRRPSPPHRSRRLSPPHHSRRPSPPYHSRRTSPPYHSRRTSPPRRSHRWFRSHRSGRLSIDSSLSIDSD